MFYFMKTLNSLKNPVERMAYFQKEDERLQTMISNLNQMTAMISSRYSVYDKTTKADINYLAEKYKTTFRDYRSAMIKDSKKVDLPNTLIAINNRMIKEAENFYVESTHVLERLRKELGEFMKKKQGSLLLEKIYPQKEEYIRSFETVSEGVRAWECLVAIVEDGTVELKDLPEYGIDIEGIVLE